MKPTSRIVKIWLLFLVAPLLFTLTPTEPISVQAFSEPLSAVNDDDHGDAYWAALTENEPRFRLNAEQMRNVNATAAHLGGEWGAVITWPHTPVSMANLPDGRILTWSGSEPEHWPSAEQTYYTIFDPTTEQFENGFNDNHNMFCAEMVLLDDGRLMAMGGRNTVDKVSIYDPTTESWAQAPSMNSDRWYPTGMTLADGTVFVAAGRGGRYPERWDEGMGWTQLTGADLQGPILDYGAEKDGAGWWPLMHLDPRGNVFHYGGTPQMHSIDPTGSGSITPLGPNNFSWFPEESTAIMYDEGKILVSGGAITSTVDTSSDKAAIIDINNATPVVTEIAPMNFARQFSNEVVLPTGDVLVIGGNGTGVKFSDEQSVLEPELWNPDTQTWTVLNAMSVPRNYHSAGLLLADGRVLSGGGGYASANADHPATQTNGQIFSPPYLFESDGSLAPRPQISAFPATIAAGETFAVESPDTIDRFTMIRASATTHTMNTGQRFLEVPFTPQGGDIYDLTAHSNVNVIVPGYWMLFAIDANGVPSVGQMIHVVGSTNPEVMQPADVATFNYPTFSLQIEATDPFDNPLTYSAAGLPDGLDINSNTGEISGDLSGEGNSEFTVTVTVSNGVQETAVIFTLTIIDQNGTSHSEAGSVTVSQSGSNQWHTVNFAQTFSNPIVVMGAPSRNDTDPTVVRVRNVTSTSFQFQLDEWEYQDGTHGSETVSYVVMEEGTHTLPNGNTLRAGSTDNISPSFSTVPFGTTFTNVPVVLTQIVTINDPTAAVSRIRGVTETQFEIQIDVEAANGVRHDPETIHWIALEPTVEAGIFEADITPTNIDEQPETTSFNQSYDASPIFIADFHTTNNGDPAGLRYNVLNKNNVQLLVEEEQSNDQETAHPNEAAGYLAINPAMIDSPFGETNGHPVLTVPPAQTNMVGDTVSLTLSATDPDDDPVTFFASDLPDGLSLSGSTISGQVTVAGEFTAVITVSDGQGGNKSVPLNWTVVVAPPLSIGEIEAPLVEVNTANTYIPNVSGGNNLEFKWNFGDGTPETSYSDVATAQHTFTQPGRYLVTFTVLNNDEEMSVQFYQTVYNTLTANPPSSSSRIVYESRFGNDRIWNVNPDNDTVTVISGVDNSKIAEIPVGDEPNSLGVAPNGRIWVINTADASISIINPNSLLISLTIYLPIGSDPYGIVFSPDGNHAYIALEATGKLLQFNATTAAQTGQTDVGTHVRELAINADSDRVYVSRFITPPLPGEASGTPQTDGSGGEVVVVNANTLAVVDTVLLRVDSGSDFEAGARGVPNYLGAPVIAPDGKAAWVPSKEDNILRGTLRDGQNLTFEHTVRAIVSNINMDNETERFNFRLDLDNSSVSSAAAYTPKGNLLFVALETSREVAVIDAYTRSELFRINVGRAPQGVVVSDDGGKLFVYNFMDRTVSIYDIADLVSKGSLAAPNLATVTTVANETLTAQVFTGKQLFYDAADDRLAGDNYMSCASCHAGGGQDGRVWDLTGMGEGLRNTISLEGHGNQGSLHWTGNFDEVQDFEGQIRTLAGGTGLLTDTQFNNTSDPLGAPKAGLSSDLDALAAYVNSLSTFGASPYRNMDGTLSNEGEAGKQIFIDQNCAACHSGNQFTDSPLNNLHDVGTINQPSSGDRLGANLTGFDSPTLRGLWLTAPYLHDGSAATLTDAINAHDGVSLSNAELDSLISYLSQIDDAEPAINNVAPSVTNPNDQSNKLGDTVSLQLVASDENGDRLQFSAQGLPSGVSIDAESGLISGMLVSVGETAVTITVYDGAESSSINFNWLVEEANVAPSVTTPAAQNSSENETVSLQINATDLNDDTLSYSATGLPAGLSINSATGKISGQLTAASAGNYTVVVTVSDSAVSSSVTFSWVVAESESPAGGSYTIYIPVIRNGN